MRNICYLLAKTPFADGTFKFFETSARDKHPGHFYSPHQMVGWAFGKEFNPIIAKSHALHDISHVIDLTMEGSTNKLLKQDFGWTLQPVDETVPREWMLREMHVVAIQHVLKGKTMRDNPSPTFDKGLMDTYNARTSTPVADSYKQWKQMMEAEIRKAKKLGFDHFVDVWKTASSFVKENREPLVITK